MKGERTRGFDADAAQHADSTRMQRNTCLSRLALFVATRSYVKLYACLTLVLREGMLPSIMRQPYLKLLAIG